MLNQAPTGYTEHVRDPKPFITEEGKIRFILGAQREDLSGTALIYEMTDLDATPQLIGEFKLPDFDNQQVFMWECPDLLKLQEQDLFLWSPQGKAQKPTVSKITTMPLMRWVNMPICTFPHSISKNWIMALTFMRHKVFRDRKVSIMLGLAYQT